MPYNADSLNRLQIREQQELNRQRRVQEEAEKLQHAEAVARAKAPYSHVTSQLFVSPAGTSPDGDDAVEVRVYLRECEGDAAQEFAYRESKAAPAPARPGPISEEGPAQGGGAGLAPSPGFNRGQVPKYLQKRKAELQAKKQAIEQEAQRQRELAKIPPGRRLVSEQEKLETLQRLEARQKELEMQLSKIPIRFDTHAIKVRRQNIEEELAQIETDKVKYSLKRPLYVPMN